MFWSIKKSNDNENPNPKQMSMHPDDRARLGKLNSELLNENSSFGVIWFG